ncbi:MAG: hypothetical protein LBJ95_02610 [Oscillospiraceae bacterium]|jgi:hypothetical protein|nr:hypothetical protein [Oscillospiraceae bacterium]
MKDQVKRFVDELVKRPELARKLGELKTQKEGEAFLKPYLDGLSYEEFVEELRSVCAQLNEANISQVAGGAVDSTAAVGLASQVVGNVVNVAGGSQKVIDLAQSLAGLAALVGVEVYNNKYSNK